jgi:hypothetical protein
MKNTYKYFSFTIAIILSSMLVVANHDTQSSGNWSNNNTWIGNSPPTNPQNTTIIINSNHDVILNGDFSPKNNVNLHVYGYLEITGDFIVMNNFIVTIHPGGTLIVGGNFSAKNNADFTINGEMAVAGNFEIGDNTNLNGNGTIYVGGEHDLPSGSDVAIVDSFLPISLLSFDVKGINKKIQINWSTATEINNDFFTLERSIDGNNWEILAYIDGAGNSNQLLDYEYTDEFPYQGISYYRLKQTDYDGKFEYFAPVAVNLLNSTSKTEILKVTTQRFGMNLWLSNQDPSAVLTVSDIYGRIIFTGNVPSSGYNEQLFIEFPEDMAGKIIVMLLQGQFDSDAMKLRVK